MGEKVGDGFKTKGGEEGERKGSRDDKLGKRRTEDLIDESGETKKRIDLDKRGGGGEKGEGGKRKNEQQREFFEIEFFGAGQKIDQTDKKDGT